MESIDHVKEALAARAETTTLAELESRGTRQVRVIRASDVASMIQEAVERTIEGSDHVTREAADQLVAQSRTEFERVLADRRREIEESRAVASELERLRERNAELERALDDVRRKPGTAPAGDTNVELMMRMMNEIATLKAGGGPAPARASGDGEVGKSLTDALDKITSSMNERLEQFGRKMGISSAVEADAIHFDALFKDMDSAPIESNLDSMDVKETSGSGIAGNLARLKKLKGGGN